MTLTIDEDLNARVTKAFVAHVANNRGPDLKHPDYGISATISSETASRIDVVLTFKKNARYADADARDHFGTYYPRFWERLRQRLADVGIMPVFPMVLHIREVIEEGALLYHGHTTLPEPHPAHEHEDEYHEDADKDDTTPEPQPPPDFTGIWTRFHPGSDDAKCSETTYVDGRKEGRVTSFAADGRRTREGYKLNGQWHGTMSIWGEDEELLDQTEWVNGTGTYRIFYCSGVLASEHQFSNGKPHGIGRKWNGRGELTVTAYFEDGKLVRFEGLGDPR